VIQRICRCRACRGVDPGGQGTVCTSQTGRSMVFDMHSPSTVSTSKHQGQWALQVYIWTPGHRAGYQCVGVVDRRRSTLSTRSTSSMPSATSLCGNMHDTITIDQKQQQEGLFNVHVIWVMYSYAITDHDTDRSSSRHHRTFTTGPTHLGSTASPTSPTRQSQKGAVPRPKKTDAQKREDKTAAPGHAVARARRTVERHSRTGTRHTLWLVLQLKGTTCTQDAASWLLLLGSCTVPRC
jgi:hypothetical protein